MNARGRRCRSTVVKLRSEFGQIMNRTELRPQSGCNLAGIQSQSDQTSSLVGLQPVWSNFSLARSQLDFNRIAIEIQRDRSRNSATIRSDSEFDRIATGFRLDCSLNLTNRRGDEREHGGEEDAVTVHPPYSSIVAHIIKIT